MLHVFEVHLAPGSDGSGILSDEIKSETQAQLMTLEEARQVGFSGFPDLGERVRLIAVSDRDGGWIEKALERSDEVAGFRRHEVDA